MRLLLRNPRSKAPVLIVCATNHALDAFLEGVLDFEPDVVRVGGRSSSEKLADRNLRDLARRWREMDEAAAEGSTLGAQHVRGRRAVVARLRETEKALEEAAPGVEYCVPAGERPRRTGPRVARGLASFPAARRGASYCGPA